MQKIQEKTLLVISGALSGIFQTLTFKTMTKLVSWTSYSHINTGFFQLTGEKNHQNNNSSYKTLTKSNIYSIIMANSKNFNRYMVTRNMFYENWLYTVHMGKILTASY